MCCQTLPRPLCSPLPRLGRPVLPLPLPGGARRWQLRPLRGRRGAGRGAGSHRHAAGKGVGSFSHPLVACWHTVISCPTAVPTSVCSFPDAGHEQQQLVCPARVSQPFRFHKRLAALLAPVHSWRSQGLCLQPPRPAAGPGGDQAAVWGWRPAVPPPAGGRLRSRALPLRQAARQVSAMAACGRPVGAALYTGWLSTWVAGSQRVFVSR